VIFPYMRISKPGEDEVEVVRRTEWYVKLQMILFHVVSLWFVALSDLPATRSNGDIVSTPNSRDC
jgi:hypothetical protein